MMLANLPFFVKLLIAMLYDALDALNVVPITGDLGELIIGGSLAFLLTGNLKAAAAGVVDGIAPPPIDILPTVTAAVIASELGWLD